MNFSYIVSRWANFYFFIQNISEWHPSNQKDYNALWRKELGGFSQEEEEVLMQFKEIRTRYRQGRTFFESAFFVEQDPWKILGKNLSQKETVVIKRTLGLFEEKFNALYRNDLPLLNQWKKILEIETNNSVLIESVTETLNVLFKTPSIEKEIKIFLLLSLPNHIAGGANIDKESVSLEVSRFPTEKINYAIGTVWHEIIHLVFQNPHFFPLLLSHFADNSKQVNLVNEIVAGSLFPRGILGEKLFGNGLAYQLAKEVSPDQTIKILNATRKCVENQTPLNEEYLNEIADILRI